MLEVEKLINKWYGGNVKKFKKMFDSTSISDAVADKNYGAVFNLFKAYGGEWLVNALSVFLYFDCGINYLEPMSCVPLWAFAHTPIDHVDDILQNTSISHISNEAFLGCTQLEEFFMPDNIITIDPLIITGCSKIKTIKLSENLHISNFRKMHDWNDDIIGYLCGEPSPILNFDCDFNCKESVLIVPSKLHRVLTHSAIGGKNLLEITLERHPNFKVEIV